MHYLFIIFIYLFVYFIYLLCILSYSLLCLSIVNVLVIRAADGSQAFFYSLFSAPVPAGLPLCEKIKKMKISKFVI